MWRRRGRLLGAVAFGCAAVIMAGWTGGYWAAALDPVDSTPGELMIASTFTAVLSGSLGACAWVLVRPCRLAAVTWATALLASAFGMFLWGAR